MSLLLQRCCVYCGLRRWHWQTSRQGHVGGMVAGSIAALRGNGAGEMSGAGGSVVAALRSLSLC